MYCSLQLLGWGSILFLIYFQCCVSSSSGVSVGIRQLEVNSDYTNRPTGQNQSLGNTSHPYKRKKREIWKYTQTFGYCDYQHYGYWDNEEKYITGGWHYRSNACKIQDISLLCVSSFITLTMIIGNTLGLTTLISSGLVRERPFMIHTSMAVNHLLLGLMPLALSVYDQVTLMVPTQHALSTNIKVANGYGYRHVCSNMLMISVDVSLYSIALFSIERLMVLRKRLLHQYVMAFGIGLSWILGIGFSLFTHKTEKGWNFVCHFHYITKLSFSLQSSMLISMINRSFELATAVFLIIPIFVAMIIHLYIEKRKQKTISSSQANQDSNINHVTWTFVYMVLLFSVTSLPALISFILNVFFGSSLVGPFYFFYWWFLMFGISWNWALYAIRRRMFRDHTKKVLCWKKNKISQVEHTQSELGK